LLFPKLCRTLHRPFGDVHNQNNWSCVLVQGWQRKLDPELNFVQTLNNLLFKADWQRSLSYMINGLMAPWSTNVNLRNINCSEICNWWSKNYGPYGIWRLMVVIDCMVCSMISDFQCFRSFHFWIRCRFTLLWCCQLWYPSELSTSTIWEIFWFHE